MELVEIEKQWQTHFNQLRRASSKLRTCVVVVVIYTTRRIDSAPAKHAHTNKRPSIHVRVRVDSVTQLGRQTAKFVRMTVH